jgi:hypothetical protein
MRQENIDVMGDKSIKNDADEMYTSDEDKQKVWLGITNGS